MANYRDYSDLNMAQNKRTRNKDSFGYLFVFWIIPFVLINLLIFFAVTSEPDFEISIDDHGSYESADITVTLTTVFPVKSVEASFLGEPLELTKENRKTWKTSVNTNGTFEVKVTNLNGMSQTTYDSVDTIDDAPPVFTEYERNEGYIAFYVDDAESGVDFSTLTAITSDGKEVTPSLQDEGESFIVYNYEGDYLEVHVFDKAGYEGVAIFDSSAPPAIVMQ